MDAFNARPYSYTQSTSPRIDAIVDVGAEVSRGARKSMLASGGVYALQAVGSLNAQRVSVLLQNL